jgi:hypothetical protein
MSDLLQLDRNALGHSEGPSVSVFARGSEASRDIASNLVGRIRKVRSTRPELKVSVV